MRLDPMDRRLDVLRHRFGLHFASHRRNDLEAKLQHALSRSGMTVDRFILELNHRPDSDPLVQDLLDDLTIGETYFFRDRKQLTLLEHVLLPELASRRSLRGWSAGCASGEEAYTLALLLDRVTFPDDSVEREVIATDIVEARLQKARQALYGERSLLRVDPGVRAAYFERRDGAYRFRTDRLRTKVIFQRHNLLRDPPPSRLESLDLIVCRNVLIYYEDPLDQLAISKLLAERLTPGGFLLLGHTERAPEAMSGFRPVHWEGALAYEKIAPGPSLSGSPNRSIPAARHPVSASPVPDESPVSTLFKSSVEPIVPSGLDRIPHHRPVARRERGEISGLDPLADHDALLDQARTQADVGNLEQGLTLALRARDLCPRSTEAVLMLSSLSERKGDLRGARAAIEEGLFLCPDSLALRYYAVSLFERLGLPVEAAKQREVTERLDALRRERLETR